MLRLRTVGASAVGDAPAGRLVIVGVDAIAYAGRAHATFARYRVYSRFCEMVRLSSGRCFQRGIGRAIISGRLRGLNGYLYFVGELFRLYPGRVVILLQQCDVRLNIIYISVNKVGAKRKPTLKAFSMAAKPALSFDGAAVSASRRNPSVSGESGAFCTRKSTCFEIKLPCFAGSSFPKYDASRGRPSFVTSASFNPKRFARSIRFWNSVDASASEGPLAFPSRTRRPGISFIFQ